jgi:hypothetical protein
MIIGEKLNESFFRGSFLFPSAFLWADMVLEEYSGFKGLCVSLSTESGCMAIVC